ncbi:hypothetical protein [Pseudomonas sp. LG1D9]|uniref:hypothetical protein n=1 Tax=Pseudomonas sp. LG1D9 TaxID=2083054 RepID=UPI000CF30255|nr:hypothetical protein [Pseudomonas sp. LG1D9]
MKRTTAYSASLLIVGLGVLNFAHAESAVEKQATQILLDACPTLVNLQKTSEVSSLVAIRQPAEAYDEKQLGWKEIVQVAVTLTSPVKTLPRDYYASGHTCFYDIGDGGMFTVKSPCKKICNFDTSTKGAAYLPVPATKALQLATE